MIPGREGMVTQGQETGQKGRIPIFKQGKQPFKKDEVHGEKQKENQEPVLS